MFIENKYYKVYYSIIDRAKSRDPSQLNYVENHHVIPKSLGGTNEKSNIVPLSAREHFVCHLCLVKMTAGVARNKMAFSIRKLAHRKKGREQDFKITSKIYELLKREASLAHKALWTDPKFRADTVNAQSRGWTPEKRTKQSNQHKQMHIDNPELRHKLSHPGEKNGMFGQTHTDKVKAAAGARARLLLSGKTYEEIHGDEQAKILRQLRSEQMKLRCKNEPNMCKGANNPNAKTYEFTSPDGETYLVTGRFKTFCIENGISHQMLSKRKFSKGWSVRVIE